MSVTQSSLPQPEKSKRLPGNLWTRYNTLVAQVATLIVLFIFFALSSETFLRPINLNNILAQMATLAIFGTGMTFVLLTGQIDLSIAQVAALTAMIAAHLYKNEGMAEAPAILIALAAAILTGMVSGIASTRFRIPTFMSTLAASLIASGLTTYISKGRLITDIPEISSFLGSGRIQVPVLGEVRVIIIVAAVSLLLGWLVLRYTRFGRYIYMTGANQSAARLAGVNTNIIIVATLTISGFCAGLAGIVGMGRLGSAQPAEVPSYLIDTIGAVVLGGTSLTGGRGGILQTFIGLLIYGTLRNGLDNIPSIDPLLKDAILGLVLLVALVVNVVFSGRAPRDKTV